MTKSNFCGYNDVYIVLKKKIRVTGTDNANKRNKKLTFKNNAPFTLKTIVNNTFTGNAEDLDIVRPMNNLLE